MRIAVVIPAHNEAAYIGSCLERIEVAVELARSHGHDSSVYVVCDACDDATESLVSLAGYIPLVIADRNVGKARAHGSERAIRDGAAWLAFTDAETEVSDAWLINQLNLRSDVVCGTVQVNDWGIYGSLMKRHFAATYFDVDGHRHIHGANLGISAEAYQSVGGFPSVENSEDVHIVRAMEARGFRVAWSNLPRVVTSARVEFRATAGFGATLATIAALQQPQGT